MIFEQKLSNFEYHSCIKVKLFLFLSTVEVDKVEISEDILQVPFDADLETKPSGKKRKNSKIRTEICKFWKKNWKIWKIKMVGKYNCSYIKIFSPTYFSAYVLLRPT